jgi:trk system potassium uptake protein TrkA
MGVDIGLNAADLLAHLVVDEIGFNNTLTLMKLSRGNYSIVEIKVDGRSASAGKPIRDLGVPGAAVIIAVYRGKEVIIPRGDTVIHGDDIILTFANRDSQALINGLFSARARQKGKAGFTDEGRPFSFTSGTDLTRHAPMASRPICRALP